MGDQPTPPVAVTAADVIAATERVASAIMRKFEMQQGWNLPELVMLTYVQHKQIEVLTALLAGANILPRDSYNEMLVAGIDDLTKHTIATTPAVVVPGGNKIHQ